MKVSALRRKALDGFQDHLLHAAHLHFDIEESLARVELQHILQARRLAIHRTFCMDLFQSALAHHHTVELLSWQIIDCLLRVQRTSNSNPSAPWFSERSKAGMVFSGA